MTKTVRVYLFDGHVCDIDAVDEDGAGLCIEESGEQLERGGLARPRGAHDRHRRPRLHLHTPPSPTFTHCHDAIRLPV